MRPLVLLPAGSVAGQAVLYMMGNMGTTPESRNMKCDLGVRRAQAADPVR
jgi:hypothetical protein